MDPIAKPWWRSNTIWGVIILAVSGLLGRYGVDLAPDDQKALVGAIIAVVSPVGELVGMIQAIWGRARAQAPLTGQIVPRGAGGNASAFFVAPLAVMIAASLTLAACTADQAKMYGGLALAVGNALYTIECQSDVVGQTGGAVVASIRVSNPAAAAKVKAAMARNDGFVTRACPLATAVKVVVAN